MYMLMKNREDREPAFFGSVMEALSAAAPKGSTVQAIGFDTLDCFLREEYRPVERDADVVIARGGEREFLRGRCAAKNTENAKLILCPTRDYAAAATSAYIRYDGAFAVRDNGEPPFATVIDQAEIDRNLASIFGEIVSLDLNAFDMTFAARMRGDNPDTETVDEVASLVTATTEALCDKEKNRDTCASVLADAGKRAAKIVSSAPELLHCSGAAQVAEAMRMLYAAEERATSLRGETQMILSAYVSDFYIKNLNGEELLFPPDNNKRIDSVCEYFGADLRRACVHLAPIYPPIKMRLCEYRRDEFRNETARLIAGVKKRRLAAESVFRRLYPDDGYSLKTLVDPTDLGICLALAPDVFAADSMLSFLKQTGRLERYIV